MPREAPLRDVLFALADNTRLQILHELRIRHQRCHEMEDYLGIHVADLVASVGLSQPAVSKHLAVLRHAGLVTAERRGSRSYYRRDEKVIAQIKELIATL